MQTPRRGEPVPGLACAACVVACVALFPVAAVAVPADAWVGLAPGGESFLKPGVSVTGVAWEPESALHVEPLPSDEVFVQAKPGVKGDVLLLVAGVDRATVYHICVGDPARDCGRATSIEDAKPKCPGLAQAPEDGTVVWRVPVRDDACLGALTAALAGARVPPASLRVSLADKAVFAYAARLKKSLAGDASTGRLKLSLWGPMLRLEGPASRETFAKALLRAWREVPGRLAFEDATTTLESAPGAPRLHSPFIRTPEPARSK